MAYYLLKKIFGYHIFGSSKLILCALIHASLFNSFSKATYWQLYDVIQLDYKSSSNNKINIEFIFKRQGKIKMGNIQYI
jgi:hypothetical protein